MYLLDTNICIYIMHDKPLVVRDHLERAVSGQHEIALSAISLAELRYGVAKSHKKRLNELVLESFLTPLRVLPWDEVAAAHYGTLRAHLEAHGRVMGNMDLLIAAHARSVSAVLVTNDKAAFGRLPGLSVENWAA